METLNLMPFSDPRSDRPLWNYGGFSLVSQTCNDEEWHSNWCARFRDKHRGLSFTPQDMKFIRWGSTSNDIPLLLSLTRLPSIFVGVHQAMSRWEWMNTFESQCIDKQSDIEREEEEEKHTHMHHPSIDRHRRWSEKPSLQRNRIMWSRLTWISFYISSRRIRICLNEERSANISFSQLDYDDNFTLPAMTNRSFDLNRLTDGIQRRNWINRVQW